jgi:hypothetical protein
MVPFGIPFDQEYTSDIEFNNIVSGGVIASDIGSLLSGGSENFVLSQHGAAMRMECVSCGAKGNLSFDGKLAFSISDGLTKADLTFINNNDFVLDAIYKFTVDARAFTNDKDKKGIKQTLERELISVPIPGSIYIPKIVTIGAAVVLNAAASIYFDAHGEITAGARFSIGRGSLMLNALGDQNELSGFHPSLEPVFNITGASIVATADLATPLGFEVGISVLAGTWEENRRSVQRTFCLFHRWILYRTRAQVR